ncbi:MAG: TauD/TfdA family dioxygenase, partial [Pseudomonadota bacterium]
MAVTQSALTPFDDLLRPMVAPGGAQNFGVELDGIDLRQLDDAVLQAVRHCWSENPLVLLRDQLVDENCLMDFSRHFGELEVVVRKDIHSRHHPEVALVSNLYLEDGSNIGGLGTYELRWHSDQSYRVRPATGAVFYALEIPPEGGNTRWINMVAAWAALTADVKAALIDRRGLFAYQMYNTDITDADGSQQIRELTPDAVHPLALRHPRSGEVSLYFDPTQTFGIEGLGKAESDELVAHLVQHVEQPQFIQEHAWRLGDVMLWDNARLLHSRRSFDPLHPRLAKRTTI